MKAMFYRCLVAALLVMAPTLAVAQKAAITDYSTTASSNEDVGGVNIQGTAPASNMDDAVREVMSHLAETNAGTNPVADTWTFGDPADLTQRFRFDAGSVTAGQTRVITVPDENVTLHDRMGLFKVTYVTTSSTHTFDSTTKYAQVEVLGAGGAGGGPASAGAGNAAAGGGGGAGAWAVKFFSTSGIASGTVTIGAAGTGSAGSAGGDGGNSSWVDGTNTITANGGTGGSIGSAVASYQVLNGASGGTATGGDVNIQGNPGENATYMGASTLNASGLCAASGGNGGNSRYGAGGRGAVSRSSGNTAQSGNNGTGYGSGGSGGISLNASSTPQGGDGTAGLVVVREYR